MRFGFNDVWWPTLHEKLDWLVEMGCDCARFGVAMPMETWATDSIMGLMDDRDLRPYFVLGGWNPAPPTEVYASWVGQYVERYGTKATYCLWNEPNYHSDSHPDPLPVEKAVALNQAGRQAARAVNPDVRVIYSPVGPHGNWEEDYFKPLYRELPRGDVALHCYPGGAFEDRLGRVEAAYELAAEYGRVHVTEIDMAAAHLGETDKPKLAAKGYKLLDDLGAVAAMFNSIQGHQAEAKELKRARLGRG